MCSEYRTGVSSCVPARFPPTDAGGELLLCHVSNRGGVNEAEVVERALAAGLEARHLAGWPHGLICSPFACLARRDDGCDNVAHSRTALAPGQPAQVDRSGAAGEAAVEVAASGGAGEGGGAQGAPCRLLRFRRRQG